jgi:hypothetical protein
VTRNAIVAAIGATWYERLSSPSRDAIYLALISSLPFVVAFGRHDMKDEDLAANICCSCSQFVDVVAMIATRYEMLLPSSITIK